MYIYIYIPALLNRYSFHLINNVNSISLFNLILNLFTRKNKCSNCTHCQIEPYKIETKSKSIY